MERAKGRHGGALMVRAEIDTSSPFRSVKEAVMLFGEKVLAGEIENKLKEMRATANKNKQTTSSLHSLEAELEQTKQSLVKAREERKEMVNCLNSLIQELDKTKTELKQLKSKQRENPLTMHMDSEVEDIKFVENTMPILNEDAVFESNRFIRFLGSENFLLDRQVSMDREVLEMRKMMMMKKKKKKKAFLPMIASIFSKKKGYRYEASVTSSPGLRSSSDI